MLLTVAGAVVLLVAGTPLMSYFAAKVNMIIIQDAPVNFTDNTSSLSSLIQWKGTTTEQSETAVMTLRTSLGTITCDRIALSAPLYNNDSETDLLNGAGRYQGSGLPGEGKPILVSGHDTTFFAPLEQIKIGDIVKLTTDEAEYSYEVIATKVAEVTDTSAYDLTQEKEQLILYTCYPFGQLVGVRNDRYFVYCNLISTKKSLE